MKINKKTIIPTPQQVFTKISGNTTRPYELIGTGSIPLSSSTAVPTTVPSSIPSSTEPEIIAGPTGPIGFQGAQGPAGGGGGFFDGPYPTGTNISNTINYNSIGTVTGTGRKFPVLLDDGSLTFDYIKTTDLINSFTVSSFVLSGAASVLIAPSGSYSLNGRTFTAAYTPALLDVEAASISVDTSNVGYPLSLSPPYTTVSANGTSIPYPASKNTTVTFTITATASDGSSDTATDTLSFRQYNYWGVTANSNISVGDLISLADNYINQNH